MSVVTVAVAGFLFWILAARMYPARDVGSAAAAISLAQLVGMLSLMGFDMSTVKYVNEANVEDVISSSIFVVFAASATLSVLVVLNMRCISEKISEILLFPLNIIFIIVSISIGISSIFRQGFFVGIRKAKYSFFQSSTTSLRLFLLPILVFLGSAGIFLSFSVAPLTGMIFGIFLVFKIGYRLKAPNFGLVKRMISYALSNYAACIFETAPGFILPVMVVNMLGAEENAYFYIAWAIANLIVAIPRSTSMSLFAECSYCDENVVKNVKKAIKFSILLITPVIFVIYFFGALILSIFGASYVRNSLGLLKILVVAAIPYSVNAIYTAVCRAKKEMRNVVAVFFVMSFTTLALSYILIGRIGIVGIGYSWVSGNVLSALLIVALLRRNFLR